MKGLIALGLVLCFWGLVYVGDSIKEANISDVEKIAIERQVAADKLKASQREETLLALGWTETPAGDKVEWVAVRFLKSPDLFWVRGCLTGLVIFAILLNIFRMAQRRF